MAAQHDSALFFTCSLIELIGRMTHQERGKVVSIMGRDTIAHIYEYADILHSEPIEKTATEFMTRCNIPQGRFDNIGSCRYMVPDYWDIGEVYQRLIIDVKGDDDTIDTLMSVYSSPTDHNISNYNSDFYYQPREYIAYCHKQGTIS